MMPSGLFSAMQSAGFVPPPAVEPGRVTRFSTSGRQADKSGWIYFFGDGQGAAFGNWKTGEEHAWQAERERPQSEAERAAFRAQIALARQHADKARESAYAEAAARAATLWGEARPAPDDHAYLVTKAIGPEGARVGQDGRLIIPVFGTDGLQSLQFIGQDGQKRFLTGGKMKSGHCWLGAHNGPPVAPESVFLVEGFATAATVRAATGAPVCCCFTAGNLLGAARMIRAQFPRARLVIAGDDDRGTEGNPGKTKALEAAKAVEAEAIFPEFPLGADGTDWNDLARVAGLAAVTEALADDTGPGPRLADWHALDVFVGPPRPREWLVPGVFPAGKPSLLAAAGGIGKSFLLLDLARAVAAGALTCSLGTLARHGSAVYLTAEDDAIEVHSRLVAIGSIPPRLFVVPCPDAGGAVGLFGLDERGREPVTTGAFHHLARQIKRLRDVALICFDPLQALCGGLDLNLPQHAQHVCGELAALAAETGASVIVSHHFRKSGPITSPEAARDAIRGTGGLVDGVRSVFALWGSEDATGEKVCKTLGVSFVRGRVVHAAVVKSNGAADLGVRTMVRAESGILVDRRFELGQLSPSRDDLSARLRDAIAAAAARLEPYTKTGQGGLYARRHELPGGFQDMGKHSLEAMAQDLLNGGGLIQCRMKASEAAPGKWLDIPGGRVAKQAEEITKAAMARHEPRPESAMGPEAAPPPWA